MEERSFESDQVAIRLESGDMTVAPGSSVTVPVSLHNLGASDGFFELAVRGIPSVWVSVPSPVVRLAGGEQREVLMTIQPPSPPHGGAGRYQLVIRVADQETPQEAAEATCTLTVAALEVPGRIGILLAATEFSVAPGESVTIPLVLFNRGLERDVVSLSVDGIPVGWIQASSASTPLSPGQQQEITLTVQPPPSQESSAGQREFQILAASQAVPGQVTAADCTLTIAALSRFSIELRPQRVEAGVPAHVAVENQGNVEQVFSLSLRSPDDGLDFEPAPTQELRIPPGEVAMAEFSAKPRNRPLFGGEHVWPFTSRVQTAEGEVQNLTGEVVGKALIPSWVLPAVLGGVLLVALISAPSVALDGSPGEGAPPAAPAPTEQPTAEPPPEQPTEPPEAEQPLPPVAEHPIEPPAEEVEAHEPAPAEEGGGGLPCVPVAAGLIVVPLLAIRKKGHADRNAKE